MFEYHGTISLADQCTFSDIPALPRFACLPSGCWMAGSLNCSKRELLLTRKDTKKCTADVGSLGTVVEVPVLTYQCSPCAPPSLSSAGSQDTPPLISVCPSLPPILHLLLPPPSLVPLLPLSGAGACLGTGWQAGMAWQAKAQAQRQDQTDSNVHTRLGGNGPEGAAGHLTLPLFLKFPPKTKVPVDQSGQLLRKIIYFVFSNLTRNTSFSSLTIPTTYNSNPKHTTTASLLQISFIAGSL